MNNYLAKVEAVAYPFVLLPQHYFLIKSHNAI